MIHLFALDRKTAVISRRETKVSITLSSAKNTKERQPQYFVGIKKARFRALTALSRRYF